MLRRDLFGRADLRLYVRAATEPFVRSNVGPWHPWFGSSWSEGERRSRLPGLSNVPLLTVSGELTRFRIRDAARDNRATLRPTFSGHLNLYPHSTFGCPLHSDIPFAFAFPSFFLLSRISVTDMWDQWDAPLWKLFCALKKNKNEREDKDSFFSIIILCPPIISIWYISHLQANLEISNISTATKINCIYKFILFCIFCF